MMQRLFVAIPFDSDLRDIIAAGTRGIRSCPRLRAVPSHQLHLTLRFLGDTPARRVGTIADALAAAAALGATFELRFTSAGAFPSPKRPRVVWLGVAKSPVLVWLHRSVQDALATCDLPREKRPFRPHVTLGRFRGRGTGPDVAGELAHIRVTGTYLVSQISLVRSHLTPAGARYTSVARLPLGG